jgi:predicted GIY-YIG superfamily endonuclease
MNERSLKRRSKRPATAREVLRADATNHRSHEKWTSEEEMHVLERFRKGVPTLDIAREMGRTELAICSRLVKHTSLPSIASCKLVESAVTDLEADRAHLARDQHADWADAPATPLDVTQAFHRFHFVYAIVNARGHVYIGYSRDVWLRVKQHNEDKGAQATRRGGPWFPFSIICLASEKDARALEIELQRNFAAFARRSETSLREVLAQIGVSFTFDEICLVPMHK